MKKKIETKIVEKSRTVSYHIDNRFTWGEISKILKDNNIELQNSDIIEVGLVEGWDVGDSSREDCYDLNISRFREETDEELEKRIDKLKNSKQKAKESRYERYLELKKEFENTVPKMHTLTDTTTLNI